MIASRSLVFVGPSSPSRIVNCKAASRTKSHDRINSFEASLRLRRSRAKLKRGTIILAVVNAMLPNVRGSEVVFEGDKKPVEAFKYSCLTRSGKGRYSFCIVLSHSHSSRASLPPFRIALPMYFSILRCKVSIHIRTNPSRSIRPIQKNQVSCCYSVEGVCLVLCCSTSVFTTKSQLPLVFKIQRPLLKLCLTLRTVE